MAKSMLHALVGTLVGEGRLDVHARAPVPAWQQEGDPRAAITLEHLLTMRDGLDFAEEYVDAGTSDVIEMLFGSGTTDVAAFAAERPLVAPPVERFNYSSGTTNIISGIVARTVGPGEPYRRLLHERLFDPLGMSSARATFDDAGTWVASSYVHATARDLARFGLLYLRDGAWEGRRLLPAGWVDHGRRQRSTDAESGNGYGAQWWVVGDEHGSFWANGYEGQSILVSPALDLVVVRLGKTPAERYPDLEDWGEGGGRLRRCRARPLTPGPGARRASPVRWPVVRNVDVVVAGAGPAGVAAAVTLARGGLEVLLVDKARFPRDKCCGDGLTTGALRLLEDLGLDPASVTSWQQVDDVVVRGPAGREVRFPLPRGRGTYAAVARRFDLDAALVDLARAARGVTVSEGVPVAGAADRGDRVVVDVGGEQVGARYAVGADGMWSPLRKHLGAGPPTPELGEWHAFRQYFARVGPRASSELFVWFEPDLLPGYAWSFPVAGGGANVGFGIQRGSGIATRDMARLWPDLLARDHVRTVLGPDATPEGTHKAWPIPARVGAAPLHAAGGRALFVGDAAAATDPLTGEGIGQALLTGKLAAEAVLAAGGLDPAEAAARYAAAVRRELVADARMSQLLVRAVRHRKGVRGALRLAGATGWTRRSFGRWLFEDYPRALLATPARWGEHRLDADGAWAPAARAGAVPGAGPAGEVGAGRP